MKKWQIKCSCFKMGPCRRSADFEYNTTLTECGHSCLVKVETGEKRCALISFIATWRRSVKPLSLSLKHKVRTRFRFSGDRSQKLPSTEYYLHLVQVIRLTLLMSQNGFLCQVQLIHKQGYRKRLNSQNNLAQNNCIYLYVVQSPSFHKTYKVEHLRWVIIAILSYVRD